VRANVTTATRAARRLASPGPVGVVLIAGLVVRAVLIPITHGPDFTVWDLASRATLNGVNVYAHHPAYSGGPYTYFPFFLDIELPMQWLALHTGVSFTILGKLPIAGGDLLTTVLIVRELRRRHVSGRAQAIAAALFFLNPLVLYNGAFYGRFDSVAVALLLLAFVTVAAGRPVTWRFSLWYALSIAAKTFPVFLLPWVLRRGRSGSVRVLATVVIVLLALAAPYLISSPAAFVTDLLYSADKLPGGLSWQVVLHGLPATLQVDIGDVMLGVFVVAAIIVALVEDDTVAVAATLLLFLLLSKQVIEQYLIWPLPFVVLLAVGRGSRPARWLIAELTAAGMLVNAYFHPFGVQPPVVNVAFAVAVLATLAWLLAQPRAGAASPARRAGPGRSVALQVSARRWRTK
jgi:hypothetical protein